MTEPAHSECRPPYGCGPDCPKHQHRETRPELTLLGAGIQAGGIQAGVIQAGGIQAGVIGRPETDAQRIARLQSEVKHLKSKLADHEYDVRRKAIESARNDYPWDEKTPVAVSVVTDRAEHYFRWLRGDVEDLRIVSARKILLDWLEDQDNDGAASAADTFLLVLKELEK